MTKSKADLATFSYTVEVWYSSRNDQTVQLFKCLSFCSFYNMYFLRLVINDVPETNIIWPRLIEIGPSMWQEEADRELTLSASPATAVGELALTMANWRYSTVWP